MEREGDLAGLRGAAGEQWNTAPMARRGAQHAVLSFSILKADLEAILQHSEQHRPSALRDLGVKETDDNLSPPRPRLWPQMANLQMCPVT